MRTYEVLFILSPQVPEEEAATLSTEFKAHRRRDRREAHAREAWGSRRLAYPIQKFNEGNYQLLVFETEPGSMSSTAG